MGYTMKAKKLISIVMVVLLMGAVLTGCFNAEPTATNTEPKVLKILGYEWNVNELSQLYEVSRDNVTVELIDLDKLRQEKQKELLENSEDGSINYNDIDMFEILKEAMTGPNAPDVVFLDQQTLPKLSEEGLLLPLETYITKEKFDLTKIAPAVSEGIKDLGGGTLYALAPTYSSSALFYNKDFFDARGIAYPTDGMTWDQVFNLARDLSYEENGKKKYGFSFGWGDISNQIQTYAASLGINRFNEDFTTFTIDTPEWEEIWTTIIELNEDEVIAPQYNWEENYVDGRYKPYDEDDFISGRAAMKIGSFSELRNLSDIFTGASYWGPDAIMPEPFEWDVVTVPVHEEMPGVGGNAYINNMIGINANAENPDLAWEFVSFINGERVAKVLAKKNWELPSRTDFAQAPNGLNINIEAFTSIKPIPYNTDNDFYLHFNYTGDWEFYQLGYEMLEAVKKGEKSIPDALAEYQLKGQEILDRLNQQLKDGTLGEGGFGTMPIERGIIEAPVEVIEDLPVDEPSDDATDEDTEGDEG